MDPCEMAHGPSFWVLSGWGDKEVLRPSFMTFLTGRAGLDSAPGTEGGHLPQQERAWPCKAQALTECLLLLAHSSEMWTATP